MSAALSIPSDLLPQFRRFVRAFDRVTETWLAAGHETEDDIETAKAGVRRFIADTADPDEYGLSRSERLRHLFEFWSNLADDLCPNGVLVRPVLADEYESRQADRDWKRRAA